MRRVNCHTSSRCCQRSARKGIKRRSMAEEVRVRVRVKGKERRSEGVEEGSREKEGGEELRVAGPKGQVEPAVEGMREKEEKAGRREAVG